jgi:hypothetical protein
MVIYVHVMFIFLPYYFICALHVVDVCHDRIVFLTKDKILISFTSSCNYRVLIVVGGFDKANYPHLLLRMVVYLCNPTNKTHMGI